MRVLPTLGGQTGLNTAIACYDKGILDEVRRRDDRRQPRGHPQRRGPPGLQGPDARDRPGGARAAASPTTWTKPARSLDEIGLPLIIRPAFTLGGTGGGIAYNLEEFEDDRQARPRASPVNEMLIEESLLGWKEYELEVMRDKNDNVVIICSIENFDPMGVHTGDSHHRRARSRR